MQIRLLERRELPEAMDLVWRVFQEFEAPEYDSKGVKTFRDYIAPSSIEEAHETGSVCFYGAFEPTRLTGVLAVRQKSHISLLFVEKDRHRRGVAKALFAAFLEDCRLDSSLHCVTVNSSPYAVAVYDRLGFLADGPEQTADGIRFTPMTYPISH